jgi:cytochrome c-type biogenesis protein CcmH/NrfF
MIKKEMSRIHLLWIVPVVVTLLCILALHAWVTKEDTDGLIENLW